MNHHRVRLLKNWSLRSMLLLFLVVSIFFTSAAVITSQLMANRRLEHNMMLNAQQYTKSELQAIQDSLLNMRSALHVLANKADIKKYLRGDGVYKFNNVDVITSTLNDVLRYIPQMTNVSLTTGQSQITDSQLGDGLSIGNYMARRNIVTALMQDSPTSFTCTPMQPSNESDFAFALAIPIPDTDGYCLSFSSLSHFLSNLRFAQHPYVISSADRVIAAKGLLSMDADDFQNAAGTKITIGGDQYHIQTISLKELNWQVTISYPQVDSGRPNDPLSGWWLIYLAIFVISECVMALAIYTAILTPIGSIHAQTMALRVENGHILNPIKGKNELSALAVGINEMIERTTQLGHEMSKARLNLVQAEVQQLRSQNMFLQAQINPHFLYNMLECICGMSSLEDAPRTREMTTLLAKLYRYCVDKETGTLEDELECVQLYAQMIGLRYDEAYEITWSIPEDLLALELPRMILEPVVENAVQHGFIRGHKKNGHIHINASFAHSFLTLSILDNGCGITPEQLLLMNQQMASRKPISTAQHTGIGFYNVNNRIKLKYGANSGLTLSVSPAGGLCVILLIHYN